MWLHWDSRTEKAYCFVCQNIYFLNQLTFSKCAENAFISPGFNTWKNATKEFTKIKEVEPRALYIQYMPQFLNLAVQDTCRSVTVIGEALDTVLELSKIFK